MIRPGSPLPDVDLVAPDGKPFKLSSVPAPLVAVFFRGAWCPLCVWNLARIQARHAEMPGVTVIGITADKVEALAPLAGKKFSFVRLAHTPGGEAFKAFDCYRGQARRGIIPWPTVVIADGSRVVRYVEGHTFLLGRTRPKTIVAEVAKMISKDASARLAAT